MFGDAVDVFSVGEDLWSGLIFSSPLFVIPENMKPSKVILRAGNDFVFNSCAIVLIVEG